MCIGKYMHLCPWPRWPAMLVVSDMKMPIHTPCHVYCSPTFQQIYECETICGTFNYRSLIRLSYICWKALSFAVELFYLFIFYPIFAQREVQPCVLFFMFSHICYYCGSVIYATTAKYKGISSTHPKVYWRVKTVQNLALIFDHSRL